ncbi:hypothetical protein E2C01_047677 [Portunus trituberculatus]|uniref:Uncharacterized protein n=1 Tax=Portunus trituberculatus TaxID=210409 RepID=A0A5B7G8E6_PORTR|nr:hypothetical protein [Portunus trituberculatus]
MSSPSAHTCYRLPACLAGNTLTDGGGSDQGTCLHGARRCNRSGKALRLSGGNTAVKADERGTMERAEAAARDDTGRVGGGGLEGGGDTGGGPGRGSVMAAEVGGGGGDRGTRGRGSSVMAGVITAAAGQ